MDEKADVSAVEMEETGVVSEVVVGAEAAVSDPAVSASTAEPASTEQAVQEPAVTQETVSPAASINEPATHHPVVTIQEPTDQPTTSSQELATSQPTTTTQNQEEAKEQETKATEGLLPNQHGRYTFFTIAALSALVSVALVVNAVRTRSLLLSLPALAMMVLSSSLLWSCADAAVFTQHESMAGGSVAGATAVLVVMVLQRHGRGWCGVAVLLLMAVVGLHLLVPIDSPAARLLLPWRHNNNNTVVATDANAEANTKQDGQRHTKQIRHRTVSVFHDWPAPIPFPARTLYSFKPASPSELAFKKHEDLVILDCRGNWWQARHPVSGQIGFVPSNFIRVSQRGKVLRSTAVGEVGKDGLACVEGQTVEVMEVHEAACLCRGVDGKIGSVPSDAIQLINE